MDFRLGVIGFGNMGAAIVSGAINKGALSKDRIGIFDNYEGAIKNARTMELKVYNSEKELIENSGIILIAVKPIHAKELFKKIGSYLKDKLIISIVAGLEAKTIEQWIKKSFDKEDEQSDIGTRILRVMPNTPAIVGMGVFAFDRGTSATPDEKKEIEEVFKSIGIVEWVDETLFPVITGLSGGGPAYVAMFIEALADAGVLHGLKRDMALKIAAGTVLGSAAQILGNDIQGGIHPAILKDMVCSPAGTTIEGVRALEENGFRAGIIQAVDEATLKAKG